MPFTPFHFGPSACIALPLSRYIDVPVFILANVAVDVEPLLVMVFDLNYPVHGYCHTLLIGSLVGILWAAIAYSGRSILRAVMEALRLSYKTSFRKMLASAILGVWFHVMIDSLIHSDIKPCYPFAYNPVSGLITAGTVRLICAVSFIPALMIYLVKATRNTTYAEEGKK